MPGSDRRCLMAVHAHPDDEGVFTGGVLARYGAAGVTTVLVTCTNGELGFGAGGVEAGQPGHDEAAVVATRREELERSARALGITHLELLGFHDSGMAGWPDNDAPGSFWSTPVPEAAGRLIELIERYRPQVVLTYDANGFYGHPDHIQAHRITMAAAEATGLPERVLFPEIPSSWMRNFSEQLAAAGVEVPEFIEDGPDLSTPDAEITALVDCTSVVARKYEAVAAHASQPDNAFFIGLGPELFARVFSVEAFVTGLDRTGEPPPLDDLFAGIA
ncbi:MAG TPA: PIG-L family deacetylase [Acidimicrobiales bacterium]|nr:PIG-L family deacetylase [Acidimicrobiales bacterium]